MADTFLSLKAFFIDLIGFKLVLDMGFSQALSLRETRLEFLDGQQRPLLASSCPGWICYAEKTQGNEILKMISKVRSAQQIQGALIKSEQMSNFLNVQAKDFYHVSVMSCYDKKLEASREDFVSEENQLKDVDCVLTSGEVQKMLDEKGWDLKSKAQELRERSDTLNILTSEDRQFIPNWIEKPLPRGSSSGGYLFNVLRSVILDQSPENLPRLTLSVDRKRGTGIDYSEFIISLEHQPPTSNPQSEDLHQTKKILFRGAHCYGFKNLQNVVRKLKGTNTKFKGRSTATNVRRRKEATSNQTTHDEPPFDYVEVMACPSGCLNGGGQIPAPKYLTANDDQSSKQQVYTAREWVSQVERKYFSDAEPFTADTTISDYLYNSYEREQEIEIEEWLDKWIPSQEQRFKLFRTQYHAVAPQTNGFAVQW